MCQALRATALFNQLGDVRVAPWIGGAGETAGVRTRRGRVCRWVLLVWWCSCRQSSSNGGVLPARSCRIAGALLLSLGSSSRSRPARSGSAPTSVRPSATAPGSGPGLRPRHRPSRRPSRSVYPDLGERPGQPEPLWPRLRRPCGGWSRLLRPGHVLAGAAAVGGCGHRLLPSFSSVPPAPIGRVGVGGTGCRRTLVDVVLVGGQPLTTPASIDAVGSVNDGA